MSESKPSSFSAKKALAGALIAVLLIALFGYGFYQWFCCRVYVPAGSMAVVTSKVGTDPKPGAILVEKGEKGIWREVLGEGRHFFDPFCYDVKILPAIQIPLGKVGIVTSKIGTELKPGEVIAPDHESKGVWRDVLGPGVYRMNPEGYRVEITDALNIPVGYVGVVTSQTGSLPKAGDFASMNEKGVLEDILQPGLYYINRYAYQINIFEVGMNQITMMGSNSQNDGKAAFNSKSQLMNANNALMKLEANALEQQKEMRQEFARKQSASFSQKLMLEEMDMKDQATSCVDSDSGRRRNNQTGIAKRAKDQSAAIFGISRSVEFPSRDGFKITLEMTVEFELMPEKISRIYLLYGDLPQVVEKIIMPQVLSVSRMKGSSYRAQDFILGEGRETFQNDLRIELGKMLAAKNIMVHNAIIRNVDIPMNILTPIRAVSVAREQNLTNGSLQETAKKLAELNTETELIKQRRQEVQQETQKLVAKINAERNQEVAEINAQMDLAVANIRLKEASIQAKIKQLRGETAVQAEYLVRREAAQGDILRAKALGNGNLAKLSMVKSLNPNVQTTIIYAGEGTLWTDLKDGAVSLPKK